MAGLADDRYAAMLIGDEHHLPAGVLRVMLRAKELSTRSLSAMPLL
jgi:hypothetical protein